MKWGADAASARGYADGMNLSAIFYLAAVVSFVLVTFGVTTDDVNLLGLGLTFTAAGLLVGGSYDRRLG